MNRGVGNCRGFGITADQPVCIPLDVVPNGFYALGDIELYGNVCGLRWETDPLSSLVIVSHDSSYPMRVVKHPLNEVVNGVELGEHRKVMPIFKLRRVCFQRNIVTRFVLWSLVDIVL